MASLRAEGIDTLTLNSGIDTLVPVLVRVARVTTAPRIKPATLTPPHAPPRLPEPPASQTGRGWLRLEAATAARAAR